MRDPHVEWLRYRLTTGESLRFNDPPPLELETAEFKLRLDMDVLKVTMKSHHAHVGDARARVEPFLKSWEVDNQLRHGWRQFAFQYDDAHVVDRNPPGPDEPQTIKVVAGSGGVAYGGSSKVVVGHPKYPDPPASFLATPDVETMWSRFGMYRDGREPLLSMAYVCLTVLEGSTGATGGVREAVCRQYRIERAVRDKLGDIVSERGGPSEARKLGGSATGSPLTPQERTWVEDVIRALIRRKAEYDANPSAALPEIMLSDFQAL